MSTVATGRGRAPSAPSERVRAAVGGLDWILLLAVAAISALQHLHRGRGHRERRPRRPALLRRPPDPLHRGRHRVHGHRHPPQPRQAGALGLGPVGRPARRARGGLRRGHRGQGLQPLDRHRPLQPAAVRDRQGGARDHPRRHRHRAHGGRRHAPASRCSSTASPPSRRWSCSCSPTSAPRWSTSPCWARSCSWWACPGRTSPWPGRCWPS